MKKQRFPDIEKQIRKIRKEYRFGTLLRKDLAADPWDQFARWFLDAVKKSDNNANVMTLATSAKNVTSARCVLLKGFDERGLLFHTNLNSVKAEQILENPQGAAVFYWPALERQVIATGRIHQIPVKEAKLYFKSRPRESQIAAWCSLQSRVLKNREELDSRFQQWSEKFKGKEVPFPAHWGGFRLKPVEFEFWQGRANRLNDRLRYRQAGKSWLIERIEP